MSMIIDFLLSVFRIGDAFLTMALYFLLGSVVDPL